MTHAGPHDLEFFLGGHDLEMLTIRDLLAAEAPGRWHDRGLAWGAKASAYSAEVAAALAAGRVPVLIELGLDLPLPEGRFLVVDHHNELAGQDRPTSLEQVFGLLGLGPERWTRWFDLVAANDRGHIAGMLALSPPASREEIDRVRRADRRAQGVTDAQEQAGVRAAAAARVLAGGRLTVVEQPHDRTSPAADCLEPALGGPGYRNLLILTPCAVHFFGEGWLIRQLDQLFPGGWYGGLLPQRGFWGRTRQAGEGDWLLRVLALLEAEEASSDHANR